MSTIITFELRDYETKRPLSAHSSIESAMESAMFFVKNGYDILWTDAHGRVEGKIKFEIVQREHRENPRQTFR